MDFGFRMTLSTSEVSGLKLKEGDFIEILNAQGSRTVSKVEVNADEIYTYAAKLKHLSDADIRQSAFGGLMRPRHPYNRRDGGRIWLK